jgi:hypothetical protein
MFFLLLFFLPVSLYASLSSSSLFAIYIRVCSSAGGNKKYIQNFGEEIWWKSANRQDGSFVLRMALDKFAIDGRWMELAQNRDLLWAFVWAVLNIRVMLPGIELPTRTAFYLHHTAVRFIPYRIGTV